MGCGQCSTVSNEKPLKSPKEEEFLEVMTLNYGGIFLSPFQLFSGSFQHQLKQLSKIFFTLMPKYVSGYNILEFEWNLSQIDKKLKNKRYSPLFNVTVGIQNNKFITRKRFIQIWEKTFEHNVKMNNLSITDEIKIKTLEFDLLAFHTLLFYVYKVNSIDQAVLLSPQLYLDTYRPFFDQTFLDEALKICDLMFKLSSSHFDIIFMQEVTENLINALVLCKLNEFFLAVSQDRDTLILAKKGSFSCLKSAAQTLDQLTDSEINSLIWNNHTCIIAVDDYILISGHLSQNKIANLQNIQLEKSSLKMLKTKFLNHTIICGCSANGFVARFSREFNIFPESKEKITTQLKRTYLHTQFKKSECVVMEAKDHILSDLKILEGYIVTIEGHSLGENTFLPLNEHPYNHLLVGAKLQKPIK